MSLAICLRSGQLVQRVASLPIAASRCPACGGPVRPPTAAEVGLLLGRDPDAGEDDLGLQPFATGLADPGQAILPLRLGGVGIAGEKRILDRAASRIEVAREARAVPFPT